MILQSAESINVARDQLFNYLNKREKELLQHQSGVNFPQLVISLDAIRVLRQIISPRSESLTGFSALEQLFNIAHKRFSEDGISPGFIAEFRHLFLAVNGKPEFDVSERIAFSEQSKDGRTRYTLSEKLDTIARDAHKKISRYLSGFEPAVIRRRLKNQRRILKFFGGTFSDWTNYRWHLTNIIRDGEILAKLVQLTPDERKAIELANEAGLPFGITPYYVSLMDYNPKRKYDQAIRAQVIPSMQHVKLIKSSLRESNKLDYMRERDTSPGPLITRRYPMIAIFKPIRACPQICVYCQRNWERVLLDNPSAFASPKQIDEAINWFRTHSEVTEVLITGGDPLIANTSFIKRIMGYFAEMKHIVRIRIGSRIFVTLPQRVDPYLVDTIASYAEPGRREVVLVTHIEHVYEVTEDTLYAVQLFRRRGIPVYNQMVFTRYNSRRFEAVALRRLLRLIGVDPYYTFSTQGKAETIDFRVPIARCRQELYEEARITPGIVRTDEAVFNLPGVGKNYLRAEQDHNLIMILADGRRVYEYYPWRKYDPSASPHIEVDVGIWEYLQWLKSVGEDPKEYSSIWYYY